MGSRGVCCDGELGVAAAIINTPHRCSVVYFEKEILSLE